MADDPVTVALRALRAATATAVHAGATETQVAIHFETAFVEALDAAADAAAAVEAFGAAAAHFDQPEVDAA